MVDNDDANEDRSGRHRGGGRLRNGARRSRVQLARHRWDASTFFQRTWTAALVAVGIVLGLIVFTLALNAALGGFKTPGGLTWPMYFNICYSWVLFFGGDSDAGSRIEWLFHFLALASIGAGSFVFVLRRLRRMCE